MEYEVNAEQSDYAVTEGGIRTATSSSCSSEVPLNPNDSNTTEDTSECTVNRMVCLRNMFVWTFRRRPPDSQGQPGAGSERPPRRLVVPNHTVPADLPPERRPNAAYAGNRIRTTKYTLLNFVPKNLFEQFHRFANLYFLGVVVLNWVPYISAFGKEVAMLPIVFVLAVTAIKDAFEDRRRYRSDKRVNNMTCRVYCKLSGRYVNKLWREVTVGDIVHLSCNEIIPADILLLRSSDEQGICYIESANLDGESNLKQRQVVGGFAPMQCGSFKPDGFSSMIECDGPNHMIYKFHGCVYEAESPSVKIPVTTENLLLRECVLKNTDFIEGIVVYAGHESKAMLNNSGPRHKISRLERILNRDIVFCIIILMTLCLSAAIGSAIWFGSWDKRVEIPFLPMTKSRWNIPSLQGFVNFWTFIIVLQFMIPLSLYITVELIKLGQAYHIHADSELYDERYGKRVECRALNIPEDLGQVEHIFSDKTGTLTENLMVFRRCTIGGVDYGGESDRVPDWNVSNQEVSSINGDDEDRQVVLDCQLLDKLRSINSQFQPSSNDRLDWPAVQLTLSPEYRRIQDFFLVMAVCNTVVVSKHPHMDPLRTNGNPCAINPDGVSYTNIAMNGTSSQEVIRPSYEGESPDEIALVQAAFQYGCRLLNRTLDRVQVDLPGVGFLELRVLHLLPFDSVRKRMSVILEDYSTGQRILYCKGADSTVLPLLATTNDPLVISTTEQNMTNYSKLGLRILCMTKRVIPREVYDPWAADRREIELATEEREHRLYESACRIEKDLELIGASGVEDRLQDGVPEAIRKLQEAGMVVWVLTGDKQETAVNIAYSCNLFSMDTEIFTLNARSRDAAENTLRLYLDQLEAETSHETSNETFCSRIASLVSRIFNRTSNCITPFHQSNLKRCQLVLVVDGPTLTFVLEKRLERQFLKLAMNCSSVLCCRTTPSQKASVVKLVKDKLKVLTLAIGDGANDVSMIQTADVGIGISGQEGMQAVTSSDYAIARFKHLERLLLVHGHWCYDKLARTILYYFYKSATFVLVVFWYQFYCGFSGQIMIDQLYRMLYTLIFTSVPPFVLGVHDRDAPDELLLQQPKLYSQGRESRVYRKYSYWINVADALYQSLVLYFVPHFVYHDSDTGIWEFGTTIFSALIIVQILHISIEIKAWTVIHLIVVVLSVVVYFVFANVYNALSVGSASLQNPYFVIQHTMKTPDYWLVLLLTTVMALIPRFCGRALKNTLMPTNVTIAMIKYKSQQKMSSNGAPAPMICTT